MDLSKMIQTGKYKSTGIEGVQLKELTTHADERGYFREIIRTTDDFFAEGFGQWSESMMYTGTVKAWHIHQKQIDWWYIAEGVVRAVLCDLRDFIELYDIKSAHDFGGVRLIEYLHNNRMFEEYILGGFSAPVVLKIPPGVAHGCKVLNGPAKLTYITSHVYNPDDEGRIPYDALGYDWLKGAEIK